MKSAIQVKLLLLLLSIMRNEFIGNLTRTVCTEDRVSGQRRCVVTDMVRGHIMIKQRRGHNTHMETTSALVSINHGERMSDSLLQRATHFLAIWNAVSNTQPLRQT